MRVKTYIGDFETSTGNEDGSTNVYLWGYSDLEKENRYIGLTTLEFLQSVEHGKIKKVYFHNLRGDGKFIVHELIKQGFKFENEPFQKPKEDKAFSGMQDDRGTFYDITIRFNGTSVKLSDTAKLFPMSVEDMGHILGLPKLDIDYDKYKYFDKLSEVPDILIEYLGRDIDIVIDIYKEYVDNYGTPKVTIGANALKSFKKSYGEYNYVKDFGGGWYDRTWKENIHNPILTKEQGDDIALSYRGGLVVFNPFLMGKEVEADIYSVDFNSLYPGVMMNHLIPYGKPMKHEPLFGTYAKLHKIYISKGKLKEGNKIAGIPRNDDKSKYEVNYQAEIHQDYFSVGDLELEEGLLDYDLEYEIIETTYFHTKDLFSTGVNEGKGKKENAPNKIQRLIAKLLLNNLYGKTAQKYRRGHRIIMHDPYLTEPGVRYGHDREFVEVNEISENIDNLSPIHTGSYITMLARVTLMRAVRPNQANVIYCDTDSMYVIGLPVGVEIHDTEFMKLKFEKRMSKFKFIKPKSYIAEMVAEYDDGKGHPKEGIHRAIAGLNSENHEHINFDNFYRGYEVPAGKRQAKNVDGGLILTDIKYTL